MRKLLPTVAGISTIFASFIVLAISIISLSAASISYGYRPGDVNGFNFYYIYYLAVGVLGVVSFSLGLAASFFLLKHRRLAFSLFGLCLLVACGAVMCFPLWFFGFPILALAVLSVVLLGVSKSQFT